MSKFLKQRNKGLAPYEAKGFRSGFTLVETLVAVSIFSVSLIAIMSVLASGISHTNYAKRKMTATYLAQEGIEYIRNMRDAYILYPANGNWLGFLLILDDCKKNNNRCGIDVREPPYENDFIFTCAAGGVKCKLYDYNGSYMAYPQQNTIPSDAIDSGFVREIWWEPPKDDNEVKVFSRVTWTQGSGTQSVTFSVNLFNWWE